MTEEWNWFDSLPGEAQEEIIALERERDAMREIVQAVANGFEGYSLAGYCRCGPEALEEPPYWRHQPDCLITKARTLLNK